jgi:hypothetical protein
VRDFNPAYVGSGSCRVKTFSWSDKFLSGAIGSVTTTTRRQPGAGVLDAIRRRRKDPFEQVGLGAARPVIH